MGECTVPRAARRSSSGGTCGGFLSDARAQEAAAFVAQYRAVRERDGHRSHRSGVLPHASVRAARSPAGSRMADSARELCAPPGARAFPTIWLGAMRVLELGAGCAWLSYRLATHGYRVVAVDRLDDEADGLGACRHYPIAFPAVQADFDALPFEPYQFDVVVFNASLHYSSNPAATPARGGAHALARRRGGGDGFSDVLPGCATARRWSPTRSGGCGLSTGSPSRFAPASGFSRTRGIERAFRSARPPVPVLPIARTAVVAAAAPDRHDGGSDGSRPRSACGSRDDRALQSRSRRRQGSSRCRCRCCRWPLSSKAAIGGRSSTAT